MASSSNDGQDGSVSPQAAFKGQSSASAAPELLSRIVARDDLLALFFHLLWEKQGRGGHHHVLEGINIPDTLIVNHSRAIHWYFTAKDGTIKMKSKKHLTTSAIMEHLTSKRRVSASGACCWITGRASRGVDEIIDMRAGNEAQLQGALADGATTGLVQNFVDPKGETMAAVHNAVLVANWTPNVLYVERRVNTNDLRANCPGKQLSLEERTSLAESMRFVRVTPLVSTHTTQVLEQLCQTTASHIEHIYAGLSVTNLVLYVKIDEENRPWVLFCSSIRVMHLTPDCRTDSASLSVVAPKTAVQGARSRSALAGPLSPSKGDAVDADGGPRSSGTKASVAQRRSSAQGSIGARDGTTRRGQRLVVSHRNKGGAAAPASSVEACQLCHEPSEGDDFTVLARRHALFPLSIVQFFSTHAPGTVYNEQETDGVVPPGVLLMHPGMGWSEYVSVRDDASWLDERVALCSNCAAGLESITANLHVGADGAIRVPVSGHPLTSGAGRRAPKASAVRPAAAEGTKQQPGLPPLGPGAVSRR